MIYTSKLIILYNKDRKAAYDLYQEYKEIEAGIEDAKELAKESDPE